MLKAIEFLRKQLKDYEKIKDNVAVIGFLPDGGWWHIHKNEGIPTDTPIAIKFRWVFGKQPE